MTLDEYYERRPLLSKKGRLIRPGWAAEDVFEYNKQVLSPRARRREREFYQVSNSRFVFQVEYGHGPGLGRAAVGLTDMETGERYVSGKWIPFPGDSLDLDFSGGEPHTLKYEDKELFLSIGFDGEIRRIVARSDRFDADLTCHDAGDAVVTASEYGRASRFSYIYNKVFRDLAGHVHMHKLDCRLDGETFLLLRSVRGVLPWQTDGIWASGAAETDGGLLALHLAESSADSGSPSENALFLDGQIQKLRKVYFQYNENDLLKPWHISDGDRRVHLAFSPDYENPDLLRLGLVDIRRRQLFGRLRGWVETEEGERLDLDGTHFFVEHYSERW